MNSSAPATQEKTGSNSLWKLLYNTLKVVINDDASKDQKNVEPDDNCNEFQGYGGETLDAKIR